MVTLHGQLHSSITLADLCRVFGNAGATSEVRQSSHFEGGEYLRLSSDFANATFERVSSREILVGGNADDYAALRALAWSATRVFSQAGLEHRLEVYEDGGRMRAYFHHQWPVERVWIGHLPADAILAAEVADVARDAGASVTVWGIDRWPIADSLAALVEDVICRYDAAIWFLREDAGREVTLARELAELSQRNSSEVSIYWVSDESVTQWDGESLNTSRENGAPLAIVQDALPRAHVCDRRLLVVDDTFYIENRGIVLTPDVPLHLLPESSQQKIQIWVCTPSGQARVFAALVNIPLVNPPRNPNRKLAYVLMLPEASRDDVPAGSEVWLEDVAR